MYIALTARPEGAIASIFISIRIYFRKYIQSKVYSYKYMMTMILRTRAQGSQPDEGKCDSFQENKSRNA
jgi:hypothetical protein